LASQSRTLNFILEWSGFLLSAFGAYMLSFGVGMSGMWTAWAAWLAANVVGACFAIRNRHYGLALQSIVFMPSSMKGLITALQLAS
jgi:hypothetical protein